MICFSISGPYFVSSYEYEEIINENEKFNKVYFDVKLSNIHNDVYILDEQNYQNIYNNETNEIIISKQKPGSHLKFSIYGNKPGCYEEKLTTVYVTLPSFNEFYTDPIWKNIPKYSLCNKWATLNISHDEFIKKVNSYIKSLGKDPEIQETKNNITLFEKILDILAKYSLFIFVPIIILCAVLIFYLVRKDDFDLSIK